MIARHESVPRHYLSMSPSILLFLTFSLATAVHAQDTQRTNSPQSGTESQQTPNQLAGDEQNEHQQLPGIVSGTVVDETGAVIAGARVTLTRDDKPEDESPSNQAVSGDNGQFSFARVVPGPFQLTITSPGFAAQTLSGNLHSGESYLTPQIVLAVANDVTEVRVVLPPKETAEAEIKQEEKQRVFGVVPNFYVSYIPDAAPLSSKQKFELGWKSTFDPVNFAIIGGIAGIQQASNSFSGYGPGAQGYGRRYGATFADFAAGTFIGSAILPSILKQDPRYFYKGTGSKRSRLLYALANAVICKGDNQRWQANYSNILGNLAAGGISNLYYPAEDRNGVGLTFENALVGIAASAAANVLQEFLIRRLTPNNLTKLPNSLGKLSSAFVHEGS